jgi:hypothetical protein
VVTAVTPAEHINAIRADLGKGRRLGGVVGHPGRMKMIRRRMEAPPTRMQRARSCRLGSLHSPLTKYAKAGASPNSPGLKAQKKPRRNAGAKGEKTPQGGGEVMALSYAFLRRSYGHGSPPNRLVPWRIKKRAPGPEGRGS